MLACCYWVTGKCRGFAVVVVVVVVVVVAVGGDVALVSWNWSAMAFAGKRHHLGNDRAPRGD